MKSSVEPLEGNKVKLYVEVDEAEFDKDIDAAFKVIAREVRLPGFRNGKAPRRILEARIGLGPAREQALNDSIPNYLSKAVREHDVDLVATPQVEITGGKEEGPVEFEAECEVRPEITVPGYGGLRVEIDSPLPTAEELAEAQQAELKNGGALAAAGRPAQAGDFLTLDLSATRDGEEVLGLNTEDWSYELGQGWVTDDFDEHLTGASEGDVVEFTSTPKGTEQEAQFKVAVKAVQTLQLPELTDEWVADNLGEFDTVAEWEASLSEQITERKLNAIRRTLGGKVNEALAELVDVELPESMVQAQIQSQTSELTRQLQASGISVEQWLQVTGQTPEQFMAQARPGAELGVKTDLALRAVAKAENIEASDSDLELEYARLSYQFGAKAKDVRRIYEQNDAVPELLAGIRKQKAFDWLLHNIEIVDTEGKPVDRDLVLGHTHDDHDHDHDHDHDGHDHDHDHDHDDSAGEPADETGDSE